MLTYTDGSGNVWYLTDSGNISGVTAATNAIFDSTTFSIGRAGTGALYLSYGTPATTSNTHSVTGTYAYDSTGLSVTRSSYIGNGFMRQLEAITNTGTADLTVTVTIADNLYFDSSTRVVTTSSGNRSYTAADDWYMADSSAYGTAKMVHVVAGGARSPTSASFTSTDTASTSYTLTLAPGETRTLMHFYGLAADEAAAATLADAMAAMGSTYLAGASAGALDSVANFSQDVTASVTTTLTAGYLLNLTLTGTAAINGTGNANDNEITGNSAANTLSGLDGDDTLRGAGGNDSLLGGNGNDSLDGGAGADTMKGGAGNDSYVATGVDVITELAGGGTDTVFSAGNFSIASQAQLENVILTGAAAVAATGNAGANQLTGNAADNALAGGDGADTLQGGGGIDDLDGGAGDDVYIVDSTTDTIVDSGGTDRVNASVTFSLAGLGAIENLTLTGSDAANGIGNALANGIYGNAAANVIDGGAGIDTMVGGGGNDTYVVRNAGDVVTESGSSGGTDTVQSYLTYALGSNVENLRLMGAGAIDGTGNALGNWLTGNSAANTLAGLAGNDTLQGAGGADDLDGGAGDDLYKVESTTDTLTDSSGIDTVESTVSFSLAGRASMENLALVGAGAMTGSGNALDNVITANNGDSVLDGGAGVDTASYASARSAVTVAVDGAGQSTGGSGTDTLANFENLWGSAFADLLSGDAGGNELNGKAGNDTLMGGAGSDELVGEAGNDRLVDAAGHDSLNGGAGNDTYVVAGTTGTVLIEDSAGIDTLDASGASAGVAIDLAPGSTSNVDGRMVTLAAGGVVDAPLDVLFMQDCSGSFSDDVAVVRSLVPQVASALSSIQADNRFALASFIDKGEYVYRTDLAMTSSRSALSAALDDLVIGDGGDLPEAQLEALLHASLRTDALGFRSGSFRAAVVMTDADYHRAGDSSYVPNDGDAVIEQEDYPTVTLLKARLAASGIVPIFAVTAGNESYYEGLVEQLGFGTVVTLASDSSNLVSALSEGITQITEARVENAIGTGFNDMLAGNVLANVLTGGAGNDTYAVQGEVDRVVEEAGDGTDLVLSSGSFTLGANVENLTLTGSADIDATGNALNNQLVGNSAANVMAGGGGSDRMLGGRGNDTYVVGSTGDRIIEYAGNGSDTVQSSIDYTLGNHLDNLVLAGSATSGTGNGLDNTLVGNTLGNVLSGAAGDDTLSGGAGADTLVGGAGQDALAGGAGNDVFEFNALSEMGTTSSDWDSIADFVQGQDRIDLSALDANTATAANDAFSATLVPYYESFTAPGQLKLDSAGVLSGNTDADAGAEFAIELVGVSSLSASDLVL